MTYTNKMSNNCVFREAYVHIDSIVPGDTINHNGKISTVSRNNITVSKFMGVSLFGDSYMIGTKPVCLMVIDKRNRTPRGINESI